jgi:HEAT repeat protein
MGEPRDRWSKAEILLSALGALVMPVVVLIVGQWLTAQQQMMADATRQAERLTSLLPPLASDNPRERRLAIEVAGYLAQSGQLPLELVPALVNIVGTDGNAKTAQAASQALANVEQANPQLREQIQSDIKAFPARLYFHIGNEAQREAARRLASAVRTSLGQELVVPGIEKVPGPSQSELRFFKKAERQDAEKIAETLRAMGVPVEVRDLSARYEGSPQVRPQHFELWLGDNFTGGKS